MATTRSLLLAELARAHERAAALDREFAAIADTASGPGTDDEHDPEGATLAFEREHTAALLAQTLEKIAEIDAAIGRLDDGTYGICLRCAQPIGEDRLTVRPAAATCVRCARLPLPRSRAAITPLGQATQITEAWHARAIAPTYAHSRPSGGSVRHSVGSATTYVVAVKALPGNRAH